MPDIAGLRPTPAKVRQALFNIVGDIEGVRLLELFSGSGIMAVEALSRGATAVVSIEQNGRAVQNLKQLRRTLALDDAWRIMPATVEKGLATLAGESFDLVFADPPYEQGFTEAVPALLSQHGIHAGLLIIEESARVQPVWPERWNCLQSRCYGDSCLHFLRQNG